MEHYLIEKEGYIIRLAQKNDVNHYYKQNYCPLDSEVARLTGSKEVFEKEEVISFFLKSIEDKNCYFFLILSSDGRIVGESVINEIDWNLKSANFRIAIFHPAEREKGIGTWATEFTRDFAFQQLKLQRLELEVFSFNPRAERVYQKAGFKREEVMKDAIQVGDEFADIIVMAIVEKDWIKQKKLFKED